LKDVAARIVAIARECGDPTAANARSALVNFFAWATGMGLTTANPCIGSITPETKARDRVLDGTELVAIWRARSDDDYPARLPPHADRKVLTFSQRRSGDTALGVVRGSVGRSGWAALTSC
jgi:hypothetical protein